MTYIKLQYLKSYLITLGTQSCWLSSVFFISTLLFFSGCTSVGHEARTEPQIERPLAEQPAIIAVNGSGELAIAIELLLVSRGIDVLASPIQVVSEESTNSYATKTVTRYVVNATSVDHDVCVPEGSRQMNFHISVVDLIENQRVFAMSGDYGCKDTIVRRFESWFFN